MTILIYYVLLEALNAVRQQAQLEERAAQQDTLLAMQYTSKRYGRRATTCAST